MADFGSNTCRRRSPGSKRSTKCTPSTYSMTYSSSGVLIVEEKKLNSWSNSPYRMFSVQLPECQTKRCSASPPESPVISSEINATTGRPLPLLMYGGIRLSFLRNIVNFDFHDWRRLMSRSTRCWSSARPGSGNRWRHWSTRTVNTKIFLGCWRYSCRGCARTVCLALMICIIYYLMPSPFSLTQPLRWMVCYVLAVREERLNAFASALTNVWTIQPKWTYLMRVHTTWRSFCGTFWSFFQSPLYHSPAMIVWLPFNVGDISRSCLDDCWPPLQDRRIWRCKIDWLGYTTLLKTSQRATTCCFGTWSRFFKTWRSIQMSIGWPSRKFPYWCVETERCIYCVVSFLCSNIAIVFSPNLLRAKEETVQVALQMPLMHGVLQLMVEQGDFLLNRDSVSIVATLSWGTY